MPPLKGLTQDETDALRFILGAVSGRDRFSNQAKRFLDGRPSDVDKMPTVKTEIERHCRVIRTAAAARLEPEEAA